jgi:putative two-component system response regulator
MAIVDVYDALLSSRPYKDPFTEEEAAKIIADGGGKHFDPVLTELFLQEREHLSEVRRKYAD